jgi:molybdate transport system substrate-binding protein
VFDVPLDTPVTYPIAPATASANAGEARRFVAYVMSPAGQSMLARYGFLKP